MQKTEKRGEIYTYVMCVSVCVIQTKFVQRIRGLHWRRHIRDFIVFILSKLLRYASGLAANSR